MSRYQNMPCDDCGETVYRRKRYGRPNLCPDCAAIRIERSVVEQVYAEGPTYDAWRAGVLRAAERLAGGEKRRIRPWGPQGPLGHPEGALPSAE